MYIVYLTFSSSNIHINASRGKTCFKTSLYRKKDSSLEDSFFYESNIKKLVLFFKQASVKSFIVVVSGFNRIRYDFLRVFFSSVNSFFCPRVLYVSKKPFNGCRLPKQRRL